MSQPGCGYSLRGASCTVGVGGIENAAVNVNAASGCGWTAVSNDAWVTIISGQSGAGSGRVRYSGASNQESPSSRSGTLTIAGRTFTVNQLAGPAAPSPGPGGSGGK